MAFVKLDCGILNSTLWVEREPRDVFITALLMASPLELTEPTPQLHVRSIEPTGFVVPPGWYGFVQAAGPGIVRMAMADHQAGMDALERLGSPDPESRSSAHDGRRLVRIDGGYIVLNFMRYRDKDTGAAGRMRRFRQRQKEADSVTELRRNGDDETRNPIRGVTKTEDRGQRTEEESPPLTPQGEGRFPDFWTAWPRSPRKQDRKKCLAKWKREKLDAMADAIVADVEAKKCSRQWLDGYEPAPLTYLNGERWADGATEVQSQDEGFL